MDVKFLLNFDEFEDVMCVFGIIHSSLCIKILQMEQNQQSITFRSVVVILDNYISQKKLEILFAKIVINQLNKCVYLASVETTIIKLQKAIDKLSFTIIY